MSGARHLVFLFFVAGAAEALTTIEVQLRRALGYPLPREPAAQ